MQYALFVQRILFTVIILHTKKEYFILFESICSRNRVLANFFNKIKYSFLLFKVLVNTIFAEYPKELALPNQPSSGRKGDREER